MVGPITGPFTTAKKHLSSFGQVGNVPAANVGQNVWRYDRRTSYRQQRPYTLPLQFRFEKRRLLEFSRISKKPDPGWAYKSYLGAPTGNAFSQTAYNAAYSGFVSQLGTRMSGLTSLLEMRQSVSMVAQRALQLRIFYRALKKLDFSGAAAALGVLQPPVVKYAKRQYSEGVDASKRRRGLIARRNSRALANNVLEFNFGWAPLAKDIGDSVEILTNGVPAALVKGPKGRDSSTSHKVWKTTGTRSWTDNILDGEVSYSARIQAQVSVANPNAWLANQMGFVNPAATFWEMAPWSFLADWVSNVGAVLNSWTDFVGLRIEKAMVTYSSTQRLTQTGNTYYTDYKGRIIDFLFIKEAYETFTVERTVGGIPYPRFEIKPVARISVTRAVNAIALLVQQLKKK